MIELTTDDIRIVDYRITHPQHPKGEHAEIRITTDQPVEVKQQILQALQVEKRVRDKILEIKNGDEYYNDTPKEWWIRELKQLLREGL